MKKINLPQASRLTSPNPVTVVCTEKPDGSTNLATVSWWTYLSFNPNMIAYAMAKTSYSGEMVRNNGKVILTIPGAEIADAVMGCGSTTGRDTDKAAKFDIALTNVEGSSIQLFQNLIHFVVRYTAPGLKAFSAGDAPGHRFLAEIEDFRLHIIFCKGVGNLAERRIGTSLFVRAAIDE